MTAAISPVFRMDFQPTGLKGTALWLSSTPAEAAETFQRVVTFWLQVCVHSISTHIYDKNLQRRNHLEN